MADQTKNTTNGKPEPQVIPPTPFRQPSSGAKPNQQNINPNAGDNRNAPGTYPDITYDDNVIDPNITPATHTGIDPKSPLAADPLNSGVPMDDSSIEVYQDDGIVEMELGGTGTVIFSGILSHADYNPDLRGWERIKIFDEMRRGDATCRLGLLAVKRPLTSANWYIKPGDGEDDNGIKTTLVREELFENPNFSFTQLLNQILTFCDYGQSIFEKVYRKRVDGKVGIKKYAQRLPNTIYRYALNDGKTPGITQVLPTGGNAQIPQWKLLMFINELEGANYEGISLLRPAYQHWYYKTLYYKIDAIASERQGMGVPIIHVPPAAQPQDKIKARRIARQMRTNQFAYLNLPDGFTFEYVDTKAKELKEVKEMVLHHDREILKAFLAHFLDLGASSTGSFALSDNQSELFLYGEQYLANIIIEQLNIGIRELVDFNFTGVKPSQYPKIEVASIGQTDFEKLATALFKLAQGGYIVPDEDLERHLREAMNLPEAMQTSADKYVNPNSVNIPVPKDLNNPNNVQIKKPIRYVNSERRQQQRDALLFMEDILDMKEDIETILAK